MYNLFYELQIFRIQQIDKDKKEQMKKVSYSPYNRTYKFICLQNQLAHQKNKHDVKGLVESNMNVLRESRDSNFGKFNKGQSSKYFRNSFKTNTEYSSNKNKTGQDPPIDILKKRESQKYDEVNRLKQSQQLNKQNDKMTSKLSKSKCRVVPLDKTQKDYVNAQKYKQISMRFNGSTPKQLIKFSQSSLIQKKAKADFNASQFVKKSNKISNPLTNDIRFIHK